MSLRVEEVDVGWHSGLRTDPRLIMLPSRHPEVIFPPAELLCTDKKRGRWGFLRVDEPSYSEYADEVVHLVRQYIDDDTVIVLPEFSSCENLTARLDHELRQSGRRCIIVGGTYYRQMKGRVEAVCSLITGNREPIAQLKFAPSDEERSFGLDPIEDGIIHVFTNTGFGRFAVLVCSDAFTERSTESIRLLQRQIDFLVVPAKNGTSVLVDDLKRIARNEGWFVAYCNSDHGRSHSRLLFPYYGGNAATERLPLQARIDEEQVPGETIPLNRFPPRSARDSSRAVRFSHGLNVLAIASHWDDVWIGCVGTLMLLQERFDATVIVACICQNYRYPYFGKYDLKGQNWTKLQRRLEELGKALDFRHVQFPEKAQTIQDREFIKSEAELQEVLRDLGRDCGNADLVFIPRRDDALQEDHVLTAKAALGEFRSADVLEYEIKDFRRVPFRPSLYVDVSHQSNKPLKLQNRELKGASFAMKKAFILENAFNLGKDVNVALTQSYALARMQMRAAEVVKNVQYAEAFVTEAIL